MNSFLEADDCHVCVLITVYCAYDFIVVHIARVKKFGCDVIFVNHFVVQNNQASLLSVCL